MCLVQESNRESNFQEVGVKAGGQRDCENRAEISRVNPAPAEPEFTPTAASGPSYLNTRASVPLALLQSSRLCFAPREGVPCPGQVTSIGVPQALGPACIGESRG